LETVIKLWHESDKEQRALKNANLVEGVNINTNPIDAAMRLLKEDVNVGFIAKGCTADSFYLAVSDDLWRQR
jgi:hypothetical protein